MCKLSKEFTINIGVYSPVKNAVDLESHLDNELSKFDFSDYNVGEIKTEHIEEDLYYLSLDINASQDMYYQEWSSNSMYEPKSYETSDTYNEDDVTRELDKILTKIGFEVESLCCTSNVA